MSISHENKTLDVIVYRVDIEDVNRIVGGYIQEQHRVAANEHQQYDIYVNIGIAGSHIVTLIPKRYEL